LQLGHADHQAIEIVIDLDLATQPTVFLQIHGRLEHVLFKVLGTAGCLNPGRIDIYVTGCATTGAAAFGLDAGDIVVDCALHDA